MRNPERLREQDARDMQRMAYGISPPLHYCTGTPQCQDAATCDLCSNAARLAVQHYRPIIERRVVEHMVREYNAGCQMPHPGSDD